MLISDFVFHTPSLTTDETAGEKLLRKTLALLAASPLPFETRTTCVAPFVTSETVAAMTKAEITVEIPRSHTMARMRG